MRSSHGEVFDLTCECGRQFEKAQSLNAHFSHCLIHRKGKEPIKKRSSYWDSLSGISYVERYGEERAKEISEKIRKNRLECPFVYRWSEEAKRQRSENQTSILESSRHVKWFEVGGIKVQGTWEKHIAERFIESGIPIQRIRLQFSGHKCYTPDFYIPSMGIFLEIKGWFRDRDKEKYRMVLKDHPDKEFKLLTGKDRVFSFEVNQLLSLPDLKDFL